MLINEKKFEELLKESGVQLLSPRTGRSLLASTYAIFITLYLLVLLSLGYGIYKVSDVVYEKVIAKNEQLSTISPTISVTNQVATIHSNTSLSE